MYLSTKKLVTFALKHKDKWHTYSRDYDTVSAVCAASNLKLLTLNKLGQFMAVEENAKRYLTSKEKN